MKLNGFFMNEISTHNQETIRRLMESCRRRRWSVGFGSVGMP